MSASSPVLTPPAAARASRAPGWLRFGATTLDPRRNGLNLVRLVLATMVLVAHGWYISGDGVGPQFDGENIGGWAVFGFFAISGYLITGSRLTKPIGEYLVHRVARIFPAFLVNLLVTAAVFAPIGYWAVHRTLDGFATTPTTPVHYVVGNATLRILAYDVAGTPGNVPYPGAWNGSLWSLYYEFLCYVIIAVLGSIGLFRRSVLAMTAALAVTIGLHANIDRIAPYTQGNGDVLYLVKLLPFFLAGGILYMLTWPLAVLSVAASAFLTWRLDGWGPQLSSLFIAYAIMWFGSVLPCPDLIRRHDISYGVYIYAFPVQQLLAIAGAHTWNLALFDVVALLCTVPLAMASWLLLERRVMRRARNSTRRASGARAPQMSPGPAPEAPPAPVHSGAVESHRPA